MGLVKQFLRCGKGFERFCHNSITDSALAADRGFLQSGYPIYVNPLETRYAYHGAPMPFRVIYISSSQLLLGQAEIKALLAHSRRNNAAAGISGLMLYHDGGFFQVLEGERAAVEPLFASIREDRRHQNVIVLWQGPVERRLFSDWRMAFVPPSDWSDPDDETINPRQLKKSNAPWNADPIVGRLLRQFLRSYRDLGE